MKGLTINSVADPHGLLLAVSINTHGRNEIQILALKDGVKQLESKIEFQADEEVAEILWISQDKVTSNGRKRKNKGTDQVTETSEYFYLTILLATGEILVYSPLTKEFTNKISNESPLSCICYGGASSTIYGFDPANSILKRYSLFDSRPLESTTIKLESGVKFMTAISKTELIIASSSVHLYDTKKHEAVVTATAQKGHVKQVKHIVRNGRVLAVSRDLDNTINVISLESGTTIGTLKCEDNIRSVHLFDDHLLAVTESGKVEVFVDPFEKTGRRQVTHSAVLEDADDGYGFTDLVIDRGTLTAVYFDSFQVKLKPLDEVDLSTQGIIKVELGVVEIDEAETSEQKVEEDEEDEEVLDLPEVEDPQTLHNEIIQRIDDKTILALLSNNVELARKTVYLASKEETIQLVKVITLAIAEQSDYSSGLSAWLNWLLLCKGSVIIQDQDCIELLRLVRSTLAENIKLLPNLLSLQGRLLLLQSQLHLRQEMQNSQSYEVSAGPDNSIVIDGENSL